MNTNFYIKDANGNIINTIVATLDFVKANYEFYEEVVVDVDLPESKDELTLAYNGRAWRNDELERTDFLMTVPDYPYKEQLTAYRQALRDWPSTPEFPETRPEIGE